MNTCIPCAPPQVEMAYLHLFFSVFLLCFYYPCGVFSLQDHAIKSQCTPFFCPNVLIVNCSVLSPVFLSPPLFSLGPPSLGWRIAWTDWMMPSSSCGTMPWAPPPVCPATYTACWDRTGQLQPSEQTSLPPDWLLVGQQQWYELTLQKKNILSVLDVKDIMFHVFCNLRIDFEYLKESIFLTEERHMCLCVAFLQIG